MAAAVAEADVVAAVEINLNDEYYAPSHLTIQWHINESCNLRCQHCYQDTWQGEKSQLAELIQMADCILDFHQQLAQYKPSKLLITLTGGEPFMQPDFMTLLQYLYQHPVRPRLGILTNGTLITAERANALAQLNLAFVQMSVEGSEAVHNAIRGKRNLEKVIHATQLLRERKIRVLWSFTAHKDNYQQFGSVARLAKDHNVNRLWLDRLIPCRDTLPQALNIAQTRQLFSEMLQVKNTLAKKPIIKKFIHKITHHRDTEIAMLRALQFQWSGEEPYRCRAGEGLLTIMPDKTVYPCRRLPIEVGNLALTSLMKIYQYSPLLRKLRAFEGPEACQQCLFKSPCRGGLRCLSFATTGDPFTADPGCPTPHRTVPSPCGRGPG